jgi:hypothetical protein
MKEGEYYFEKALVDWVQFDGWVTKRSQNGFKYKPFFKPRQRALEVGGYAFYENATWIPYAGVSLRRAQKLWAKDLRTYERRHSWWA